MQVLKDILYKVPIIDVIGDTTLSINRVAFDSRKVDKGNLFVAQKGLVFDGHKFIGKAIENGAIAIICEDIPSDLTSNITYDEFSKKYKGINIIIPPLENFKLLKRNLMIIQDNKITKQKYIAIKYNLSLRSVEEIVKKYNE